MRILLAQLSPVLGEPARNVERLRSVVRSAPCDLAVFPELYLTGYRVGDRIHHLALREGSPLWSELRATAHETHTTLVIGAPISSNERKGEIHNAAIAVTPDRELRVQVKRYLPNFGPFEEGVPFTPSDRSAPIAVAGASLGLEVCYDVFFPEVSRELALAGAELLVAISAAPVTSRRLFDRLLPARAIENAVPMVYVNRVGVEDGFVFGGGSGAWDARGEPLAGVSVDLPDAGSEESARLVDIDLAEAARWRPFRPLLRDVASRPGGGGGDASVSAPSSTPTRAL